MAVHFLDNVLEVTSFPLEETAAICRANRKIGIGVMGFADTLLHFGIVYGSDESIALIDRLMRVIQHAAVAKSQQIAIGRGPFPNFGLSRFAATGEPPRRNATVTSIAPTGSISLIAGCSSGIEPLYALAYGRGGLIQQAVRPHPLVLESLQRLGIDEPGVIREIETTGSMGHIDSIPAHVRRLFRVASEIPPFEHIRVQAAFQQQVENAVSKTINLPADVTNEEVWDAFLSADRSGCKGITVYREGSHADQVLHRLGHCLTCLGEDRVPLELHHSEPNPPLEPPSS